MKKPVVVLADFDEDYIAALEEKFIEEFGEKIELEIITDKLYFDEYFKQQKAVEVLIVVEEYYFSELRKNNIKNIFILQENPAEVIEKDFQVRKILKYSSTNKIYKQVMNSNNCLLEVHTDKQLSKTKVIVVYSPIGGVGKTTLALGISTYMSKEHKVLYINAERMNTFQYQMESADTIPNSVGMKLIDSDVEFYANIKDMIGRDVVDYLLPFGVTLSALNLNYSVYNKIIEVVKETEEYDYIVVDTDTVFDMAKAVMIAKADNVILVGNQSKKTKYVMNVLKKNMVYDNLEKYSYICNCYEEKKEKETVLDIFDDFMVSDCVKKIENIEEIGLKQLAEERDIQKVSLLVM